MGHQSLQAGAGLSEGNYSYNLSALAGDAEPTADRSGQKISDGCAGGGRNRTPENVKHGDLKSPIPQRCEVGEIVCGIGNGAECRAVQDCGHCASAFEGG